MLKRLQKVLTGSSTNARPMALELHLDRNEGSGTMLKQALIGWKCSQRCSENKHGCFTLMLSTEACTCVFVWA